MRQQNQLQMNETYQRVAFSVAVKWSPVQLVKLTLFSAVNYRNYLHDRMIRWMIVRVFEPYMIVHLSACWLNVLLLFIFGLFPRRLQSSYK